MSNIVFGYKIMPVWRGGHSFAVYENGMVSYEKFAYGIGTAESKEISIPKTVVDDLKKHLTAKKYLIDKLPEKIDGWIIDGPFNYFNFLGKTISALNICKTSEDDYKKFKSYLDKVPDIYEIIRQQNSVMNIFESSVYNILKDYGLKVVSWNSFSCDWEM